MCGRTACTLDPQVICSACGYQDQNSKILRKPTWREHPSKQADPSSGDAEASKEGDTTVSKYELSANLAPTMYLPVMFNAGESGERVIQPMMWGMIPPWHKGEAKLHGLSTNNARIEGLAESKLYKRSLTKRNLCVVLSQGFYEWKTVDVQRKSTKQPYFIYSKQKDEEVKIYEKESWTDSKWTDITGWDGPNLLMMAGLYDTWSSPQGELIYSFTVITMDSTSTTMSSIHDRMPAILETQEQVENWLNPSSNLQNKDLLKILTPAHNLQHYPVSTKVNNSRCQDVDCMDPMPDEKTKPKTFMQNWLISSGTKRKTLKTLEGEAASSAEDGARKKPKLEEHAK